MLENQTTTNRGEIVGAFGNLQSQINDTNANVTILSDKVDADLYTFTGASIYDTTLQPNAGATAVNLMTYDSIDFAAYVSIENGTDIVVDQSGYYNLQFSAQFDKTDNGNDIVQIWLRKNGNDVPYSTTEVTVRGNDGKFVAAWNLFVALDKLDYVQLAWHSTDTNMRIFAGAAGTNPTRPNIPSVILTIHKIGNLPA
jgi:hypothetical protein